MTLPCADNLLLLAPVPHPIRHQILESVSPAAAPLPAPKTNYSLFSYLVSVSLRAHCSVSLGAWSLAQNRASVSGSLPVSSWVVPSCEGEMLAICLTSLSVSLGTPWIEILVPQQLPFNVSPSLFLTLHWNPPDRIPANNSSKYQPLILRLAACPLLLLALCLAPFWSLLSNHGKPLVSPHFSLGATCSVSVPLIGSLESTLQKYLRYIRRIVYAPLGLYDIGILHLAEILFMVPFPKPSLPPLYSTSKVCLSCLLCQLTPVSNSSRLLPQLPSLATFPPQRFH